jgi:predicted nucleic acid-binding protein
MIVVDASAVAELLLRTPIGLRVEGALFAAPATLHAPHLLDVEILNVVRRLHRKGELDLPRAEQMIADLLALGIRRHAHGGLLGRAFELRDNVTAYDAIYVALAEALGARLLTCDRELAKAPVRGLAVELVA